MAISKSHLAYADCYSVMDDALADEAGARISLPNEGAARFFRMRCHQARTLDRQQSYDVYADDHPMHGASLYDKLIVRLRQIDGVWWVYFEQSNVIPGKVEALSGLPAPEVQQSLPAPEPMRQIEHATRRRTIE